MILSRRQFFASVVALLLAPRLGRADPARRLVLYHVDIGILFNLFTLSLDGNVDEQVDRTAGRYRVLIWGEGSRIANQIESVGLIREGRFTPTMTASFFSVRGRESRTHISYDYDRKLVYYRHRSQTFFLGRERMAEDVLGVAPGQPLDDMVSATLNYAEGQLDRDGQGAYQTFMVRRKRPELEAPDDVQSGGYRAEIVPLRFTVTRDSDTGRESSLLDLTRFSSWASAANPARITFGADRRPESIRASLILGTRIRITFRDGS